MLPQNNEKWGYLSFAHENLRNVFEFGCFGRIAREESILRKWIKKYTLFIEKFIVKSDICLFSFQENIIYFDKIKINISLDLERCYKYQNHFISRLARVVLLRVLYFYVFLLWHLNKFRKHVKLIHILFKRKIWRDIIFSFFFFFNSNSSCKYWLSVWQNE